MSELLDTWGITVMVFLPLVGALIMMLVPAADEEMHGLRELRFLRARHGPGHKSIGMVPLGVT